MPRRTQSKAKGKAIPASKSLGITGSVDDGADKTDNLPITRALDLSKYSLPESLNLPALHKFNDGDEFREDIAKKQLRIERSNLSSDTETRIFQAKLDLSLLIWP